MEKSLAKYGFYYGMAFQIRDDLYDYIADPERVGKPVGGDIAKGIVTIPAIYAMRNNPAFKEIVSRFFAKKAILADDEVDVIISGVKKNGGIDDAKRMLNTYIERGMRELMKLPSNNYRKLLEELLLSLRI